MHLYPVEKTFLTWYWGNRMVKKTDFDFEENDEELYNIVSTLSVEGAEVAEGTEFRCEVTLNVGEETFTRVASLVASAEGECQERLEPPTHMYPNPWSQPSVPCAPQNSSAPLLYLPSPSLYLSLLAVPLCSLFPGDGGGWGCREVTCDQGRCVFAAVMEQPTAVFTSTGSPSTATAALPPGPSVPAGDPTTAREPNTETTLDLAAVTSPLSTDPSVPQDFIVSSPPAPVATTTPLPDSSTAGTGPSMGTTPACTLHIWSLPPIGTRGRALSIECRAQCAGNASVRWLRTPAALSQYREESAGSSSALRLDRAQPWHQGHYQCVLLGHRARAASLEVMVMDGELL